MLWLSPSTRCGTWNATARTASSALWSFTRTWQNSFFLSIKGEKAAFKPALFSSFYLYFDILLLLFLLLSYLRSFFKKNVVFLWGSLCFSSAVFFICCFYVLRILVFSLSAQLLLFFWDSSSYSFLLELWSASASFNEIVTIFPLIFLCALKLSLRSYCLFFDNILLLFMILVYCFKFLFLLINAGCWLNY